MTELTDKQYQALNGLRQFALHLEQNPELIDLIGREKFYIFHYGDDVVEFSRKALLLGGTVTKTSDLAHFNVEREFGPMVTVQVTARHEHVCERVVVDVEEVEEEGRDPELVAAALRDIPMQKITKTVEKIEWRCPTLLKEVG